jgi:tryptophan 2,3-dioxygenase
MIQRQLFAQWGELATLTPSEYEKFRGLLGDATGFKSLQYLQDEFLAYLARAGYPVPEELLERDWTQKHRSHPGLVTLLADVYAEPEKHWGVYETCEELVDLEDNFQEWRFRHLQVVQRTIGHKTGTGGSSGVDFLRRALDLTFFPELYEVRTLIGG